MQQDSIERRRAAVIELDSKGKNFTEIADILHCDVSTVSRDYRYVQDTAYKTMEEYVKVLPMEIAKCIARLNSISNEAWAIVENAKDPKEKMAALSLAMRTAVQIVNVMTNIKAANAGHAVKEVEEGKGSEPDPADTAF